ncbi:MAG: sigma-70 family RNA polymerase sigma factor [Ginsengibacter sp.]
MGQIKKILSEESDEALMLKYKAEGNLEVLGELYSRYMDLVYGVCLKYFKEPENAKDAVIHIFEELVTKLKQYEVTHFKGWLYRLASNHCLMKLRKDKTGPRQVDTDVMQLSQNMHPDEETDHLEKERQFDLMEYCIELLPEEQKQAIRLFYLKEKCYKEIAEETSNDLNKIRSYIQNGRRNLKNCMEQEALKKV